MSAVNQEKKQTKDVNVILKVQNDEIMGKININDNLGVKYYIKDDITKSPFLPVYDAVVQGICGKEVIVKSTNIDWITPEFESDPNHDNSIAGKFNPIKVNVKLKEITFSGELNLGYHKRLSDMLNDSLRFLSLLNVNFRGMKRTVYVNTHSILAITE